MLNAPDVMRYANTLQSDWKVSGLSFLSPSDNSDKPTSVTPISLHEILNIDPRLPRSVQLNLDYASPDFVLDTNLNVSADMFSLGLLIVALYNSPHESPLHANSSVSTYKRLFASSSTIPSNNNNYLSSRPVPKDLTSGVLPRLITRRPAQRMTAKEFQQSGYFDNILVSTIRFLDALPEKTPTEKGAFLRGLSRVIPSFPKSVMEKKVLPALLEEMKDKQLLGLILQNIFKIIELLPSGKRSFTDKILPRFREIFLAKAPAGGTVERDTGKEAGLAVLLENLKIIVSNCSGKEFKDGMFVPSISLPASETVLSIATLRPLPPPSTHFLPCQFTILTTAEILPIVQLAIESPTHSIVDAALRSLPIILPVLDFSTIKNELFPVIASVFSKTSSLGIKVRGLEAFVTLCGGTSDGTITPPDDGLSGFAPQKKTKSVVSVLDKYTMQEKIIPLLRAIKTKEPAVMLAALKVLRQVGKEADADFTAMEIIPLLWNMALGPLLDLKQFQQFMELIKSLGSKVEQEHSRKLQDLSRSNNLAANDSNADFMSFGDLPAAFQGNQPAGGDGEDDFERLVTGKYGSASAQNNMVADGGWDAPAATRAVGSRPSSTITPAPAFSWSTAASPAPGRAPSPGIGSLAAAMKPMPQPRSVTPDLNSFSALQPQSTQFSQPLQPQRGSSFTAPIQPQKPTQAKPSPLNWGSSSSTAAAANPWASTSSMQSNAFSSMQPQKPNYTSSTSNYSTTSNLSNSMAGMSMNQQQTSSQPSTPFSLPPPPSWGQAPIQPQSQEQGHKSVGSGGSTGGFGGFQAPMQLQQQQEQKKGLDAWESLL